MTKFTVLNIILIEIQLILVSFKYYWTSFFILYTCILKMCRVVILFLFPCMSTGDIVGKILAWFSLLPIFIVAGFITLIVFRREIHTVRQLFSVAVNIIFSVVCCR